MGVYGEILYPLSDLNEILHQSSSEKPSIDRGEFELDRARRKNNIAENSFALGHEMHNRYYFIFVRAAPVQVRRLPNADQDHPDGDKLLFRASFSHVLSIL